MTHQYATIKEYDSAIAECREAISKVVVSGETSSITAAGSTFNNQMVNLSALQSRLKALLAERADLQAELAASELGASRSSGLGTTVGW